MFEVGTKVQQVSTDAVQLAEENLDIHQPFDPAGCDLWFVNDIRKNGILIPLSFDERGKCTDGRRRLLAARHLKLSYVPGVVVRGDSTDLHRSAQLGRNMTVFAKCVMFGSEIRNAVEQGVSSRSPHSAIDADDVECEWQRIEATLGTHRQTLQRGVKLLDELAVPQDDVRENARMERVIGVFQRQGLKPALALFRTDDTEVVEEVADDLAEPDVTEWVGESDNDFSQEPKPEPKDKPAEPTKVAAAAKPPELIASDAWAKASFKLLGQLQNQFVRQGAYTPAVKELFESLEREIELVEVEVSE